MYFEDIKVGDRIEIPETRVDPQEMLEFSKKYNGALMHTDEKHAAASWAGRITSSGIYTFALMWGYYAPRNFCGEHEVAGTHLEMDFKKPVFAGDVLHGYASVTGKKERNPYNGTIYVHLEVFNQDGELVLTSDSDDIAKRRPGQA